MSSSRLFRSRFSTRSTLNIYPSWFSFPVQSDSGLSKLLATRSSSPRSPGRESQVFSLPTFRHSRRPSSSLSPFFSLVQLLLEGCRFLFKPHCEMHYESIRKLTSPSLRTRSPGLESTEFESTSTCTLSQDLRTDGTTPDEWGRSTSCRESWVSPTLRGRSPTFEPSRSSSLNPRSRTLFRCERFNFPLSPYPFADSSFLSSFQLWYRQRDSLG